MRLVEWTDDNGYKHLSWVKDNDPDYKANEGLRHDPPDVDRIYWDEIKKQLHNRMVEMRITSWQDVMKHQNAVTSFTTSIIKKNLIYLLREGEKYHE